MKSIAITSGKGGVGKTNLSANLAISLSRLKQRVVVFDVDIGLANLDVVLGVPIHATLQNFLSGESRLDEVLHTAAEGVRFVPGGSGVESLLNLSEKQSEAFVSGLRELAATTDYLMFDTGAGISENVLGFLKAADEVIVVVTPDPSSIADGYATIKALHFEHSRAVVKVVVNMVANEAEAQKVFDHLSGVVSRFLQSKIVFLGGIRSDKMAVANIRKRVPYVVGSPNCQAAYDVFRIASNLLGSPAEEAADLVTKLRTLLRLPPRLTA